MAIFNSSSVLPTPEKTILYGLIPALVAFSSSPPETTSTPEPNFASIFNIVKFVLALAAKQISGLTLLNVLAKFK